MKRIVLFLITNIAVMVVLTIVVRLLGVDQALAANGLNVGGLLAFSAIFGFGGAFISLLLSKTMAKWSTGAQVIVILQVTLTDRSNGAVLFSRPYFEVRERYEISVDARTYFEESDVAMERLSRDVARSVVSAVLENF